MPINEKDREQIKCHDCGVGEGKLHEWGCDEERCPFCGHQLITCGCIYEYLELDGADDLTNDMEERWFCLCMAKGRYPFIWYPLMCSLCGDKWPDLFMVPGHEWRSVIQHEKRDTIIYRPCYEYIKGLTLMARGL